jgi:class 3 adenylate cyclase
MLMAITNINARRKIRGEPPLTTGIGINTGTLIAGGLGTADRLNFTIIGDTVNTTQRMQGLARDFGESGIVVGETTLSALRSNRLEFNFEPMGEHAFKGKSELHWIYRLRLNGNALPLPEPEQEERSAMVVE